MHPNDVPQLVLNHAPPSTAWSSKKSIFHLGHVSLKKTLGKNVGKLDTKSEKTRKPASSHHRFLVGGWTDHPI